MIKINGAELPSPSDYRVDSETIGEFRRNANGGMVGDLVARKARVQCGWEMLEDVHFKAILAAVRPHRVEVEFYDAEAGGMRAAEMYANPAAARVAFRRGSGVWWRNVGVSFVEW